MRLSRFPQLVLAATLALVVLLAFGQPVQAVFDEPAGLSADDTVGLATDFDPLRARELAFPHHVYGTDVSQPHNVDQFRCMTKLNLTYTIVRVWRSLGNPDPNAPATMKAAWAGGQRYVDGLVAFVAFRCVQWIGP